jgi:glucokinase
MILAGDVGGTKTMLALFAEPGGPVTAEHEVTLASRDFASLEDAVRRFLAGAGPVAVSAACVGVAGPVVEGRATATNLPWAVSEARLAQAAGAPRARLLNDLEAMGHGVLALPDEAFVTLQVGRPRAGTRALIAAGTGLGEALLVWDGTGHRVVPTEGGHTDFGPRDDLEVELLRHLRPRYGRVSYERLVSGPGLVGIHDFLRARHGQPAPAALAARLAAGDGAAAITDAALEGGDPVCAEALDRFVAIYGAEAGNLALKALALGGVVLGGGIAPKILPRLQEGPFLAAFRDKGRFADLMATIPVTVVLEPRAALLGAARVARELT